MRAVDPSNKWNVSVTGEGGGGGKLFNTFSLAESGSTCSEPVRLTGLRIPRTKRPAPKVHVNSEHVGLAAFSLLRLH